MFCQLYNLVNAMERSTLVKCRGLNWDMGQNLNSPDWFYCPCQYQIGILYSGIWHQAGTDMVSTLYESIIYNLLKFCI